MPHSSKETLSIGWCDNGMTDGKFTEGLVYTTVMGVVPGNVTVHNAVRVQGNQIGRQRQALFDMWADHINTDWLLWVDSDIVLTQDVLKKLWAAADKISRPVVCGVYFISKQTEQSVMQPMPAVFNEGANEFEIAYLHPLPEDEIVKVDNAGLGLTLMHKSVVAKLREVEPDYSLFAEKENLGEKYIGEDIVFFRNLKKAGVPVYCVTGARVKHMKRFALDENYYKLWWNYTSMIEAQQNG
jgi:GT2 family glycosyltransferase